MAVCGIKFDFRPHTEREGGSTPLNRKPFWSKNKFHKEKGGGTLLQTDSTHLPLFSKVTVT